MHGATSDIRAALLACAACSRTECCKGWIDQGREGVPYFCYGRSAFLNLVPVNEGGSHSPSRLSIDEPEFRTTSWTRGRAEGVRPTVR